MLLRNYDNLMAISGMLKTRGTNNYISSDEGFGDGILSVKRVYPDTVSRVVNSDWGYEPLSTFEGIQYTESFSTGSSNLGVGSGSRPVTYDDNKMESPLHLTFVNHSFDYSYDEENNALVSNYRKIFSTTTDVTIREIGILYTAPGTGAILVYREVLESPIQVPAGSNVVIKFTKKQSLNQNRPTDYTATASVE